MTDWAVVKEGEMMQLVHSLVTTDISFRFDDAFFCTRNGIFRPHYLRYNVVRQQFDKRGGIGVLQITLFVSMDDVLVRSAIHGVVVPVPRNSDGGQQRRPNTVPNLTRSRGRWESFLARLR
mmetsp:Transcript_10602/g.12027  ORF Transcript_10602/g.12027 Transcript_10602/m.12027 type:complete len:121 (+) Transcript_10602:96-458(+)